LAAIRATADRRAAGFAIAAEPRENGRRAAILPPGAVRLV